MFISGKKLLLLIVMSLILVVGAWASHDFCSFLDLNFTFGRQYIIYDEPEVFGNKTTFGPGAGLDYYFVLKSHSSYLGFDTSLEMYNFNEFHKYCDFKVSTNVKLHILSLRNVDFDLTGGVGADLVFRDDKDFGVYFLSRLGLDTVLRATDAFDVVVHTNAEITTQKGSWLVHVNGSAGLRLKFGGIS